MWIEGRVRRGGGLLIWSGRSCGCQRVRVVCACVSVGVCVCVWVGG